MISICNTFIVLLYGIHNAKSLKSIDQDGVCTKTTFSEHPSSHSSHTNKVTKIFCCRHYEKQNGQCVGIGIFLHVLLQLSFCYMLYSDHSKHKSKVQPVNVATACELGYTSYSGKPCQPCVYGYYGARCAFVCICETSKRCHHEQGCVSELGVTRTPSSVNTITGENQSKTVNVITKQQLLLYIVSAVCFVLLIGVFFLGWKYRKKSHSRKVSISTKDHDKNDKKDIDLNRFESAYDEIDESCFVDSLTTVQVTKSSTNTLDKSVLVTHRNTMEKNAMSSEYLSPIYVTDENKNHDDIQDSTNILVIEPTPQCCERPLLAVSDYLIPVNAHHDRYDTSHVESQGGDYLHPYTSVISSKQRYSITADIHTENQISSESDEEANDHKYSHLYEQLSHDWRDNFPTYTHPLPSKRSLTQRSSKNVQKQNTKLPNTFQKDYHKDNGASVCCEMVMSTQSSPDCP